MLYKVKYSISILKLGDDFIKIVRFLSVIGIILCLGIFLVACESSDTKNALEEKIPSNNINLDFLITPEQMIVHSKEQLAVLNEFEDIAKSTLESTNERYDGLSKMSEEYTKIQEGIVKKGTDLLASGKIIEDKSTIEEIFNQLRKLDGIYVDSFEKFEEDIIAKIDLNDDKETPAFIHGENSYYRLIFLLENGYIVVPTPTSDTDFSMKHIKAKISKELRYELEELIKD